MFSVCLPILHTYIHTYICHFVKMYRVKMGHQWKRLRSPALFLLKIMWNNKRVIFADIKITKWYNFESC